MMYFVSSLLRQKTAEVLDKLALLRAQINYRRDSLWDLKVIRSLMVTVM